MVLVPCLNQLFVLLRIVDFIAMCLICSPRIEDCQRHCCSGNTCKTLYAGARLATFPPNTRHSKNNLESISNFQLFEQKYQKFKMWIGLYQPIKMKHFGPKIISIFQ